jgi:HEXXH motif-containing protein
VTVVAATITFDFSPIETLHRERTRRIRTVIQPNAHPNDSPITATDYCVAHHVLEGAETAARARDVTTFNWYAAHPDANMAKLATPTAAGPRVVICPDLDRLPRSEISETPYYVLRPDSTAADPSLRQLASAAYSIAEKAGFGDLLTAHAVVLVLLRHKPIGDTLDSWTITRLPGTVFCDHVGDPVVLARDLVHEAAHNWLNDALTATASKISDGAAFYSPWKQTKRTAFGFLHACWAFPLTMLYTARVLPETNGNVHRFLTAYLARQREQLAMTTDDHARALTLIHDTDLRHRLHGVHREALKL